MQSALHLSARAPFRPRPPSLKATFTSCTIRRRYARGTRDYHQARALLGPETVFSAATVSVMPLYTLMIAFPRAKLTERVLKSRALYVAGAALYAALLVMWWPRGIGQLCREVHVLAGVFSSAHATALAWLHLLLLDIAQAREVWLDGLRQSIPTWHSVILCFMFGPLGMLSHISTRALRCRPKQASVVDTI